MRKVLFLLLLVGAVPFASFAQSDVPAIEVFGGYSYLRTFSGYDDDAHGWNPSVSGNITRHFAVKADFAGHYQRYTVNRINVDYSLHTFMFGPQVNFRVTDRVNPFLHALFGVARDTARGSQGNNQAVVADTGFALAVGGGVDAKLTDHVSWRVFQADYLMTRYRNPFLTPVQKESINHMRVATGLVFH